MDNPDYSSLGSYADFGDSHFENGSFDRLPPYQSTPRRVNLVDLRKPRSRSFASGNNDHEERITSYVINVVDLLSEHVIFHPLVVIRRQCQVTRFSNRYHLTPLTVIPLLYRLRSTQGSGALWKGLTSNLIVKGLYLSCQSFIAGAFGTEENLICRGLASILASPFLCSNSIEIVQSSIASETPGVFDCLKEGLTRLTHWNSNGTRLLTFWSLCIPTAGYFILHYQISSNVTGLCFALSRTKQDSDSYKATIIKLIGNLTADIILYPLDTVIQRLYLQGTRTIIDNIDTGNTVLPVISAYEGARECFQTIVKEETTLGLYKGFGALVLQYSLHFMFLNLARSICRKIIAS
ncbi:mitochondrial outer membrane protein SLC25A46-like [Panonychus citri]|uniref:mitochondrial outer membrane protein SLC25A46-like n=1 Tax=Panonychus citri TaxID=50023 RepID=UPI0023077966|nr:mitochondrial outer membrane protein SLC25A46-like [Panonychus citri]